MKIYYSLCLAIWFCFLISCKPKVDGGELRNAFSVLTAEDLADFNEAKKQQDEIERGLVAQIETTPVKAGNTEDAADDPAIWVNPIEPSKSLIFGSNKKGGIVAFDLAGKEQQYYPVGNINNIDVLEVTLGTNNKQLLGGSNRSTQTVDLFWIAPDGKLIPTYPSQFKVDKAEIDDVYGFCFGTDFKNKKDYLFVNGKNGTMVQYELMLSNDTITLEKVRSISFKDQTEGMDVDDETGIVYVGAENTGIWYISINPMDSVKKQLISESTKNNPMIKFDIEGLALGNYFGKKVLIASSQGNFSYAIFDLKNQHKYLGSFKLIDGNNIDGVEETDGIDMVTDSLNAMFPNGVFVAQDGYNVNAKTMESQNFKLVDARKVLSEF